MSGMPWGGSEELWFRAAQRIQAQDHNIAINYKWWPETASQLLQLQQAGADIWFRNTPKSYFETQKDKIKKLFSSNGTSHSWLENAKPDAVLVTLGYHPDRIPVADECLARKIPYAINVQCASSFFFIHSDQLDKYRKWYQGATKVLFVSPENQLKLENNIAVKLDNAEIVANPFNVDHDAKPNWPTDDTVMKIACVGRIHFQSKGQDLIVDVMKENKWRDRAIEITFYGHDQGQRRQLEDLITLHGLQDRLKLGGFVDNVEEIWESNHALLLPSRYEGAPLVVIESMLCGRMPIVTDIGRNKELIDDGQSGFIAAGPTVELLDDAMERAWNARDQWKQIGQLAATHIRDRYPVDPVQEFADQILSLTTQPTSSAKVPSTAK